MSENEVVRQVRVSGWDNPRSLIIRPGKIAMEIAMAHNHCPTCARRIRQVTTELSRRNITFDWLYPKGSMSFVVLDAPAPDVSITEHLSNVLGLSIS